MSVISKKICLVGDFYVGKTSLIRRFVEDKFSDNYLTTIGVKISRKSIINNNLEQQINLLIWDIEGHTKHKSIPLNYFQGSHGAILVGDVTRPETLKNLSKHLKLFTKINPQSKTIIALNKSDLIDQIKLNKLSELYSASNYSQVLNTYLTSAKTGDYVDIMFEKLAISIVLKK